MLSKCIEFLTHYVTVFDEKTTLHMHQANILRAGSFREVSRRRTGPFESWIA